MKELPKAFADLIDLTKYDVSYSDENDEISYVVQVKEKGLPLAHLD